MSVYRQEDEALHDRATALEDEIAELRSKIPRRVRGFLSEELLATLDAELPEAPFERVNALERIAEIWREAQKDKPRLLRRAKFVKPGAPKVDERDLPGIPMADVHASVAMNHLPKSREGQIDLIQFDKSDLIPTAIRDCLGKREEPIAWHGKRLGFGHNDVGAIVQKYAWVAACCSLSYRETPLRLLAEPNRCTVRLFVASASPRVAISPEHYGHKLLKRVGVLSEIEMGAEAFDAAFLFRADDAAAVQLIDAPVQDGLLTLAKYGAVTLTVDDGLATLTSDALIDPIRLNTAFHLLTRVRRRSLSLITGGH